MKGLSEYESYFSGIEYKYVFTDMTAVRPISGPMFNKVRISIGTQLIGVCRTFIACCEFLCQIRVCVFRYCLVSEIKYLLAGQEQYLIL